MKNQREIKMDKEREEVGSSIRQAMYGAMKSGKRVQVYATGTFKGIAGRVMKIERGGCILVGETEEGTKVTHHLRLSDIKRVSVYDD